MYVRYIHFVFIKTDRSILKTYLVNMNSLLDYGSSSSASDSEEETKINKTDESKGKLPKPTLESQPNVNNSVFSNPFVQAELAKSAILEKHVKMVPGKDQVHMINGKKICWNFRKGRCRFGHNCKYAHDTDIQKNDEELQTEKQNLKSLVCESVGTVSSVPPPILIDEVNANSDDVWEGAGDRKKVKRPGLSQNIVPGKKVLKLYKEQKLKDAVRK